MKREDIIDSLEYIDEEYIGEADLARNAGKPAGDSGKVTPIRRKPSSVRRWGTLVAGLAVLIVAAFVVTGILRVRSGNMEAMKSAEATATEEQAAEHYKAEQPAASAEEKADVEMMAEATEEPAAEEMMDAAEEIQAADESMDMDAANGTDGAAEMTEEMEEPAAAAAEAVRIRIMSNAGEIVFDLNDSPAAKALEAQLPLSVDTEPYSDNEIVFQPEKPLDTENGIEGGGTEGYLGYFAPWNNVVMYYGDFEEYPGLYILGKAVSGAESIREVKGRITIEAVGE
ncbi:MAG: hypothetical protein IKE31_06745 [Eubacterium sp.]|nr:hypothetical protein [Eubacterium sp.]